MSRLLARIAGLTLCAATAAVQAQSSPWPSRPIKLIVPFAPGGSTDASARAVGLVMSQELGQPVVVENRPGAQGVTGAAVVKNSPPDGYTIGLLPSSVICVAPFLRKTLPFDAAKDFTPVGMIALSPIALVITPQLGPRNIGEFIEYAKARQGKLSYSTSGVGGSPHLFGALFDNANKLDMVHVPFQGGAPAVQAVLAGDVTMSMSDLPSALSLISAGRLLPLAVAGAKRWPLLPEVPTFSEAGLPIQLVGWTGILAPAGTPAEIIQRLNAAMQKMVASDKGRDQLLAMGMLADPGSATDMASALRTGCPPWGAAAKLAGIQPE